MSEGMFSPSSGTNLLLRAAVDVGILRAFSIDRWDLEKQVWGEVSDDFGQSLSSLRDA